MVALAVAPEAAAPTGTQRRALDAIRARLRRPVARPPVLSIDGEPFELPAPFLAFMVGALEALGQGEVVTLFSSERLLTTQQAADLLNVSRPYLIRLLENGVIPSERTGTHRRVAAGDVAAYKQQRDARRREQLDRLTQLHQELGLYGQRPGG